MDVEIEVLAAALDLLRERDGLTSGQLHRQAAEGDGLERKGFELLLDGLVRAGLVEVLANSFEKGGRTVRSQGDWLTRPDRLAGRNDVDGAMVVKGVAAPPRKRRARGQDSRRYVSRAPTRDPAGAWRPQTYPCRTSREPSAGRGDAAVAECDGIHAWEYSLRNLEDVVETRDLEDLADVRAEVDQG